MAPFDEAPGADRQAARVNVLAVETSSRHLLAGLQRRKDGLQPVVAQRKCVDVECNGVLRLDEQEADVERELVADIDRETDTANLGVGGEQLPRAVGRPIVDDDHPRARRAACLDELEQNREKRARVPIHRHDRHLVRMQPSETLASAQAQERDGTRPQRRPEQHPRTEPVAHGRKQAFRPRNASHTVLYAASR